MKHKPYGPYEKYVKRPQDFLCALLALTVLSPVLLITAILVRIKLGSPVLFKQERPGRNGKIFRLYKFRTMLPPKGGVADPATDAARLTPFGKKLRATSLDELPELFNILKGDMSVVGPRPLVPGELEKHNGLTLYNKVRPGLTGWWACNGRSNISYKERLELEYYYVKNCSLQLDILCILRTIFAVLRRDGAQ